MTLGQLYCALNSLIIATVKPLPVFRFRFMFAFTISIRTMLNKTDESVFWQGIDILHCGLFLGEHTGKVSDLVIEGCLFSDPIWVYTCLIESKRHSFVPNLISAQFYFKPISNRKCGNRLYFLETK